MVRHATLNSEDPSCHCGPARHTELKGSQLIEENDEGEEGEEEEGGEETDIKSNNPHLTGGEKFTQMQFVPSGFHSNVDAKALSSNSWR